MKLEGRIALVTGASRGIGEVIALRLASAGAKVAVNYHTGSSAAATVVDSIAASGGEAFAVGGDVSQEDQVESLIKSVVQRWGELDILVNNAGITRDKLLLRMSAEEWDDVITVNLRSAYLCTRAVLPHMIRQRHGRIVNLSSVVGLSGNPGQANYAASKAGLIGFTKAMAREVASRNVTVNAVALGTSPQRWSSGCPRKSRRASWPASPWPASARPKTWRKRYPSSAPTRRAT